MTSLRYRSDIDGLRAVAVLGVVIFHAFPQNLSGGFSGVDIFFVISGHLISGILYKGHREGGFSFKEFYARRIRRLFPALITMLVLSLAYGWVILLPDEFEQMGKHIAAGTLFIQNFVFWGESGYFDTAANLKPMLHLWSLAVEEQFYIIFPLVLILLWKKPRILVPAMVILLIVSFVLNVVMSYQAAMTDFFLTPYRAWEFLAGSLLAWWHYDKGHEEEVPKWREAMSWGGALLLAAGMVLLSKQQGAYPGWRALLPVCGTCLLIEGGRGAWVNRKILSHPGLVWIGLISYPLYLFHWPALSFVHIVKGGQAPAELIWVALGIALLLTLVTYYGIERKIRHNRSPKTVLNLVALFAAMGVIGMAIWNQYINTAHSEHDLKKVSNAVKDNGVQDGFTTYPGTKYGKILRLGGTGSQTIFLGDSQMQMYAPRVKAILRNNMTQGRGAIFTAAPASIPVRGLINPNWSNGRDSIDVFWAELENNHQIDRVAIAARWGGGAFDLESNCRFNGKKCNSPEAFEEIMDEFKEEVKKIRARNKRVYIILDIPTGSELAPGNLYCRSFYSPQTHLSKNLKVDDFMLKDKRYRDKLMQIAEQTGSIVIDPLPYLSLGMECISANKDGPIYCDDSHLRPGFVKDHAVWIDQTVAP